MKKILITIILLSLSIFALFSQTRIKMQKEGSIYTIPCKVNGLNLRFIFDTGASHVSISLSEAVFMLKNGYLDSDDIIGTVNIQIADGSIVENTQIVLRKIEIGNLILSNIKATVVHNMDAPLLLGQSAIQKLGKIQLENNELVIINSEDFSSSTSNIYNSTLRNSTLNNESYHNSAKYYQSNPSKSLYEKKIYYYNKRWEGVDSRAAAFYIREAYYSKNKSYGSYFVDYYFTGEIQCEGGFIRIDPIDDSKSIMDGYVYWYDKSGNLTKQAKFNKGSLVEYNTTNQTYTSSNQNNSNTKSSFQSKTNAEISVSYFDKYGSKFEEEFTIKNNLGKDVNSISIRFIYKLDNGETLDFKDYTLQERIPNGFSKKFTKRSFDQNQKFVYKYSNDAYKNYYTPFTVEYQILDYK